MSTRSRQRLFFATDLRGSERAFRKFLNARDAYSADLLILTGNLAGNALIPIVKHPVSGWSSSKAGRTVRLHSEAERAAFTRRVADEGGYAVDLDADLLQRNDGETVEVIDQIFAREATARVSQWLDLIAERKLPNVYVNGGNDDPSGCTAQLDTSTAVIPTEGRAVEFAADRYLVSCGYSNPTPWNCARDVSEESLTDRIDAALAQLPETARQVVFNMHTPPFDSELDSAPKLDADFQPVTVAGQELREPAGSTAVRRAIENCQPVLSLHGRILDSRGETHLGRTLAVNPGSESTDGTLLGALIDIDDNGIVSHLLTTG